MPPACGAALASAIHPDRCLLFQAHASPADAEHTRRLRDKAVVGNQSACLFPLAAELRYRPPAKASDFLTAGARRPGAAPPQTGHVCAGEILDSHDPSNLAI